MSDKKKRNEPAVEETKNNEPKIAKDYDIYTINTGAANRINKTFEPTIISEPEDNLEMLSKPMKEKMSIWSRREKKKLKDLHGMDKVRYIFAYYYQWMVVAAAVIFMIYIGCFIAYKKSFTTRLYVVAVDAMNSRVEDYLNEVLPEYYNLQKKELISIDASMTLGSGVFDLSTSEAADSEDITGAAAENTTAADENALSYDSDEGNADDAAFGNNMVVNMKLTSMSFANAIDVVIGEEGFFTGYCVDAGLVLDLMEYIPDDIYEIIRDDIIYDTNSEGEKVAAAVKMPDEFAKKLELSYEPYVSICCNTKHADEAVNFIRMMYGLEYVPAAEK